MVSVDVGSVASALSAIAILATFTWWLTRLNARSEVRAANAASAIEKIQIKHDAEIRELKIRFRHAIRLLRRELGDVNRYLSKTGSFREKSLPYDDDDDGDDDTIN
jgi:type VI protein secretion system component VasK